MATKDRGFASMSPEKQREIASKGGKAAHTKDQDGNTPGYEWTQETAREAGRKGGAVTSKRRKQGLYNKPSMQQ